MQIGNLYISGDIYQVLDQLFFEMRLKKSEWFSKGYREAGEYLLVQCPYHKFGLERKPSAQFRKSDGLFYCHACKETHSLDSVIHHCLGINGRQWLLEHFDGSADGDRKTIFNIGKPEKKETKYVDKEILKKFRYIHPYVTGRGIDVDTIRKFDIGFDKDSNAITFPVRDESGNILFIATRSVSTKFYHYPERVGKPVYGLYEIYREMRLGKEIDSVYICEGPFNMWSTWTYGKYGVSLLGTGSSTQHEQLRKSSIRHFILALDPDEAGEKGTQKLLKALDNKFVEIAVIPKGKDVNDLTKEEFDNLEIKSKF